MGEAVHLTLLSTVKEKAMYYVPVDLKKRLVCIIVLSLVGFTGMAAADVVTLKGTLSGGKEVPANDSPGTGTVNASLNTATNQLQWTVVYAGLTGPAGAGHFHGPAQDGQNAGVALGFKGSVESPIAGEATLTPEQAQAVTAGQWYVNLHTKAHPGGEIRAQLMPTN
jgi:hypothetical protein